jgi:tetratricopeptide (TPR) repeat protein
METENLTSVPTGSLIELLNQSRDVVIEERPARTGREFVVFVRSTERPVSVNPLEGQTTEYILESAGLLLKSGDFLLARNLYSYVLKKDLKDPTALKGLGTCFLRLGEVGSARRCFKALWELFHKEDSLLFLAQCSIQEKDDRSALELLNKIKSPSFLPREERYEYYKELGNCYTRAADYEKAESAYAQALNLGPTNEAAYVNLGTMEIQRERFDLALFYFKRAVQINPASSKGHCGIGIATLAAGDLEQARDAFLKALDLDNLNVLALHQLAALCDVLPLAAQVIGRIQQYLKVDPKNRELRFCLAALLFKRNEWSSCERELDEILKAAPGHERAQRLKKELISNRHRY